MATQATVKTTFQRNVLETNDVAKVAKRSSIVALAVMFLGAMAVSQSVSPVVAYFLLLVGALMAAQMHPKWEQFASYPAWKWTAVLRPIVQSILIGLPVMAVVVIGFGWAIGPGDAAKKASDIFMFGVLGAFVEEVIRWLWLQTLPFGILTANAMWVLMHPQVARLFNGQAPDIVFAAVAFLFGLMMTAFMWFYESPVLGQLGYGPLAAATFHGVYNSIAIAFTMQVGATVFAPFAALGAAALLFVVVVAFFKVVWPRLRAWVRSESHGKPTVRALASTG